MQSVFCPFCTSVVADGTIQCPECGSDLSGILALIRASEPETTGAESQINVSLSDTAIAGDVNIVQQLQADTDDIVERLVDQLECFDINKPGLSVPEEGFSRVDIEAAIPLVRENANILKGMTSPHLLQFGKLLDSMGWPEVAKRVGKYLLTRDDVQSEPLWLARSHLILARSSAETFDPAACIIHADKAAGAAKSAGLNDIEAYALYISIDKRKDLSKDSSKQGERVSALLESSGSEPGVAGAWCHLALSRYLDAVNPDTSEHHEAMGFQHASNHRDLEAMVATLLATAENRIWTIKDSFWAKVKEDSELNGLASYSMLVDLADFVRSGSEHQLLAGIRTLTRHAKGRGMTEMQTLASLVSTITDLHDMTSTTRHGSQDRQSGINTILGGEKVNDAFDEILTRSYQGFDHSLFYQFALMDLTGTQLPRIARGYLDMERSFPNDSVKAMVLLYKGLHHAGNPAQQVIDSVAEFLRDSKLGGDDVAWKLLSEIATYHSARVGEVPAERGSRDNFTALEGEQKLSKKRPISALIFWIGSLFFIEALSELIQGDENGNLRYHLMMRTGNWDSSDYEFLYDNDFFILMYLGGIIVSTILSFCLFAVGTNQRKITAIDGDNKRSFLSLLLLILIANIIILLYILQLDSIKNSRFDNYYQLVFLIAGITIVIYLLVNSKWANTWSGSSVNAFYWPRFNLTFILVGYWFAMWILLLNIHDDAKTDFHDEAAFFYGVNLMLFSTISLPLLFAGTTKESLKVSAVSVMAVCFIFMAMFWIESSLESFFLIIAMAWFSIPMSYYVWMSPWPEEVPTTEAF